MMTISDLADEEHREAMRNRLQLAAEHFSITLAGGLTFGWRNRASAAVPAESIANAGCACRWLMHSGPGETAGRETRMRQPFVVVRKPGGQRHTVHIERQQSTSVTRRRPVD